VTQEAMPPALKLATEIAQPFLLIFAKTVFLLSLEKI
jgi:hypothetical protein